MKLNLWSFAVTAIAIFTLGLGSYSQTRASDDAFIAQAQSLPASAIERRLGPGTFASWVRSLAGKDNPPKWQVNQCGHVEGIPDSDERNHPSVCMKVSASVAPTITFQIHIDFATFRNSRIDSPRLRYIFAGGENLEGGAEYETLRSMRRELIVIRRALASFDPTDGDFQNAADGPAPFEGVSEILFETKDYNSKGVLMPIRKRGVLYANNGGYKMAGVVFDGKRLAFDTASVKGVSFKFDGAVENLRVDTHGAYTRCVRLKGHIIKLIKGKKVSESDITLTYEAFPGC